MKSPKHILLTASIIVFAIACKKPDDIESIDSNVIKANPDWTTASHGNAGKYDYDIAFPQDKVNTIEITLGKTTWEAIKTDMSAKGKGTFGAGGGTTGGGGINPPAGGGGGVNPPAGGGGGAVGGAVPSFGPKPEYVEATMKFNGKQWKNIGFRLKGNSTLSSTWRSGIYKLPFRMQFDEYEDKYPEIKDQRFYGFKEISMSPGVRDNSLIREKAASDIFRMAGIPAARTAFYKVYIDFGEGLKYCGVYTMVEVIDDNMIKDQFGEEKGNIYKPESNFTTFSQTSFEKKNNKDTPDWSDVQGAITALNASNRTSDPATWRANLEKYMNMDHFVKWLAVNTTMVSWDTYGAMAHNHYLYNHSSKKLMWIPWDNNEALTSNARVQLPLTGVANTWPLIKFVADDPVYYAKYKAYVKDFNDNVFTTSKMNELFDRYTNLITPFVNGTEKEVTPYSNLGNLSNFTSALSVLKTHVVNRNKEVANLK
jgi:spore coat protein H